MAETVDGGVTWSRLNLPLNRTIRGLYIGADGELAAVGLKGTIVVGTLGNVRLVRGSPYDFKGIVAPSSKGLFLYGAGGIIRHSNDGGRSWDEKTLDTDSTINSLAQCSGGFWAVGEHGLLSNSKDAGLLVRLNLMSA